MRVKIFKNNPKILKALVITLELLALGLIVYLVILPFYPTVKYYANVRKNSNVNFQDIDAVKKIVEETLKLSAIEEPPAIPDKISGEEEGAENIKQPSDADKIAGEEEPFPQLPSPPQDTQTSPPKLSPRRIIIPKIGVNAPIIDTENEDYGLSKGAWRLPDSSTPDKSGNTVLTGHRFKYLPPSNLTFYLFHKLEKGDITSVAWDGKIYYYRVKEIKIVSKDEVSILKQTKDPTLTMFTCDPIYSTKNRLVIVSELFSVD